MLCVHVRLGVSHLISQGFSFFKCKMGTVRQWCRCFATLEPWACEHIFVANMLY